MSGSNCCFLTWIKVSQEAGIVVWYSYLFKSFQFVMIHTVKDFSVVSEIDLYSFSFFLEFSCFLHDLMDAGNLIYGSSVFLNPACTFGSSWFMYYWSLAWRIFSITLLACEMVILCGSLNIVCHCPSLGLEWKLFQSCGYCWVFQIF